MVKLKMNTKEKLSPSSKLVDAVTAPSKSFGIRSYLHQFYQSPTNENPETAASWYLLPPPPTARTGLYICRILTVTGILLLSIGAIGIIVGYTWPREHLSESMMKIAIDIERVSKQIHENGDYYLIMPQNSAKKLLIDRMHNWKLIGLVLFATGGFLLILSLLMPIFAQILGSKGLISFTSENNSPNEPPIRIFPASSKGEWKNGRKTSPTGPVPVIEEITPVQPTEGGKQRMGADEMLIGEEEIK